MDHYTYEILETGDIPEDNNYNPTDYLLFNQYLDDNDIDFVTFKRHFLDDKKIVKVKFRNIPRETPSHEKMLKWRHDNKDYEGKLTGAEITDWVLDNNKDKPDIYDITIENEKEETLPESQLFKSGAELHGVVDEKGGVVAGGNHKSRRNRKRKNIKKSKKNYKGGHKIKKNRSKRIKARISRSL